jgi:hypothetical protein
VKPHYLAWVSFLTLLLVSAAGAVVIGGATASSSSQHTDVTALTGLPDIARSTTYLEPRLGRYHDLSLKVYPQRSETGYMDFIYAP